MEYDAGCSEHRLLACGVLPAEDFTAGSFQSQLREELSRREQERKKDAAKGFQRTPAFVHAVVLDVLEASRRDARRDNGSLARGGFSDVGQHTGSEHRATAWPLVCQTIQVSAGLSWDLHATSDRLLPSCAGCMPTAGLTTLCVSVR
jgi:hypothetical protein